MDPRHWRHAGYRQALHPGQRMRPQAFVLTIVSELGPRPPYSSGLACPHVQAVFPEYIANKSIAQYGILELADPDPDPEGAVLAVLFPLGIG